MGEEIKLYKHFVKQIDSIGKIKRAWFTTFNLDISFFEKFILSAVMGRSHDLIKTPYDYEELSANLVNGDDAFDGENIEVKVFYDYRTLKVEGKPKFTSVDIYPVNITGIKHLPAKHYIEGVFHPKVTLIETYTGRYWLMVSSANLTLSAWARNRECFFFEEITNTKVARDVGKFFEGILSSYKGFENNQLLKKLLSGKFGTDPAKWRFISSFNNESFLDALNYTESQLPLRVWSPYFSVDLHHLIQEILPEYFSSIEIIPAKNENQKIRITEEIYNKCKEIKDVCFKQDHFPVYSSDAFVHAKVWLTPISLAIGSWNLTRSGLNISTVGNNNIEAGVVYFISPKEYHSLIDRYSTSELKKVEFFNEIELQEEKDSLLDEYTLSVDLTIDWDKQVIVLQQPTYNQLIKQIGEKALIHLPGFTTQKITFLQSHKSFSKHSRLYLKDRFFEITDERNKTLYKGYFREVGLQYRPVNSFENIDDYLKGWVTENPESKTELFGLSYYNDDEDGIGNQTKTILYGNDQNAWFTSFHAFECIVNRLKNTKQMYASQRRSELKKIGRVLPGSLYELRLHLLYLLECYQNNNSSFIKSPLYLWFLIEKANTIFRYYNELIGLPEEWIQPINNNNFENFIDKSNLNKNEIENIGKWKRFIKKQINAI